MANETFDAEAWEEAVLASYKQSVTPEEFENKAATNPDATRKIAYYMRNTGYDIEFFDDTQDTTEAGMVQLLYDFLNFTDGV